MSASTIEDQLLAHCDTLDDIIAVARDILPAETGEELADALTDLRVYVMESVAPELDELRDRVAWEPLMQPHDACDSDASHDWTKVSEDGTRWCTNCGLTRVEAIPIPPHGSTEIPW